MSIVGGALWGTHFFFRGPWMASIIRSCAGWEGGNYRENPRECATNAISALVPYFYSTQWWVQYVDAPEAYTRWRIAWGDYYLDIQDARDLLYAIQGASRGWLGDTPGFNQDVVAALRAIEAKALFITSMHDQFYTPEQIKAQVQAMRDARVVSIDSVAGHLICCSADPQATRAMGLALQTFLDELTAQRAMRR